MKAEGNATSKRRANWWKPRKMRAYSLTADPCTPTGPQTERFWSRRTLWGKGAVAALGLLLLAPRPAHAQFGLDLVAILAALQQMQQMMQQYIAAPLQTISQAEQSLSSYYHEVVFPQTAITQAQNSVVQSEDQFQQISGLSNLNLSSATLAPSQNLESVLLSRNPTDVSAVGTQYQSVYGPVMPVNTAAPEMRAMADMTDAEAQDAMKRAVAIDALSDAELAQAAQLGKQIETAAPGSAPILEAEADAWLIRANAYTMSAFAELTRTRSIDIANQSATLKIGTTQNTFTSGYVNSALSSTH